MQTCLKATCGHCKPSLPLFYSLVAPIQSCCDVLLDVPQTVMSEVANQHLPPQVQDFIHHVPKPVEQIPLIFLEVWKRGEKKRGGGEEMRRIAVKGNE